MLVANKTYGSHCIGGVDFDFIKAADVPGVIDGWRRDGRRGYVTLVNPHSVMMCRRDDRMREATRGADLTLPDGVGIVLAAKLLGHGRRYRVTGPALMLNVCDAGRAMGLRHFFYGAGEGVAERLAARLSERYPGLQVAGTYCPPFGEVGPEQDAQIVAKINATGADVVWVGIGAPKQEKWMADHVYRIRAAAMIGVGAAFDFHSGNVRWAPRWVRSIGFEWAYRLILNPKRMWRRNIDSPLFLAFIILQALSASIGWLAGRIKPAAERGFFDDIHRGNGGVSAGGPTLPLRMPKPEHQQAAIAS